MYKKLLVGFFVVFLCIGAGTPAIASAAIVPSCVHDGVVECTVCDVVELGQNIINFFVILSVMVAALLFVNAGALYVFSPANPGNISRAHKIFMNAVIGLLIVLTAWLVIDTVMKALLSDQVTADTQWGPWNNILCKPGPAGPAMPGITPPPTTIVGAPPTGGGLTDAVARGTLDDAFQIWESRPGATSFAGIQQTTVDGAMALAQASGLAPGDLIITGGTEAMHSGGAYSHMSGYKLDFEDTVSLDNYINSTFTDEGLRSGDPVKTSTINGRPVQCVGEASHWDCTFCPTASRCF